MDKNVWQDLGAVEDFKKPLTEINIGRTKIAISYQDDSFGAVSGVCNHAGGPLGKGDWKVNISPVHGTTGNFIGNRASGSRDLKTMSCRATKCVSKTAIYFCALSH